MLPVRCLSCRKIIANKWSRFISLQNKGKTTKEALDELGLIRYCCRRMLLGHIESIDYLLTYQATDQEQNDLEQGEVIIPRTKQKITCLAR